MAYCTNADVKTYLGITSNTDDSLITTIIAEAQDMIDRAACQSFEASTDTDRKFDANKDIYGGMLILDAPLCSINTVTNGNSVAITSGQYITEPRNATPYHAIRLLSSAGVMWTYTTDPENAITIKGKWAYSASAPASVKQLCVKAASGIYRLRDNPVGETIAIDGQTFSTAKDVVVYIVNTLNQIGLVRNVA